MGMAIACKSEVIFPDTAYFLWMSFRKAFADDERPFNKQQRSFSLTGLHAEMKKEAGS
jgi:hypothetical protein